MKKTEEELEREEDLMRDARARILDSVLELYNVRSPICDSVQVLGYVENQTCITIRCRHGVGRELLTDDYFLLLGETYPFRVYLEGEYRLLNTSGCNELDERIALLSARTIQRQRNGARNEKD